MERNRAETTTTGRNHADSEIGWYRQLSTAQAAKLIGLSTRKLEILRREGGGPQFVRISRRCVRYRLIDLIQWQDSLLRSNNCDEPDNVSNAEREAGK